MAAPPPFIRPEIRPATGLKELADSANEAARREATQWFFFVTLMLYLMVAVGGVTHRKLFLEEPIPLPVINTPISLTGFFVVAPAILVVMHFYLLAQIRVMTGKVAAFLEAARTEAGGDPAALERTLRRLDPFPVAQVIASAMVGRSVWPLRSMAWLTLVAAPVALLLFFQVRFLPYQDPATTWWHRVLVVADLVLLWVLWWPMAEEKATPSRGWVAAGGVLSAAVFVFAFATVRGETIDALNHRWVIAARAFLFDGAPDRVTNRPTSLFSRVLVLPDETLISERHAAALNALPRDAASEDGRPDPLARTLVLRGRSLRGAVLAGADLRRADLTGADLRGARLDRARLDFATLTGAQLQNALLALARLPGALLLDAQLNEAMLANSVLSGARLDGARLAPASLWVAQLQGASLEFTQLQGASLAYAQLQGATFKEADLRGADLDGAQLQGAWLQAVRLDGASLHGTQLQGAALIQAQLQGASLVEAKLQGASLAEARLEGADLRGANAWRAVGFSTLDDTDLGGVAFDEATPRGLEQSTWQTVIDSWLARLPAGRARDEMKRRLLVLVPPPSQDPEDHGELRRAGEARPPPDLERIAQRLGDLACEDTHPPPVAGGILRQIRLGRRDLGDHRTVLAKRMLDERACPGARGLADHERAILRDIAEGRR